VVNKAKSTYNPIQAASFISSLTHDVTLDDQFSSGMLLSLAERYHAFSGSSLQNYTVTTVSATYAPYGNEAVQVVQQPQTQQTITQFLGGSTGTVTTPPLDGYGSPIPVPAVTATTAPAATTATTSSSSSPPTTAAPASAVPSYDPTPC
jgi:hypothetical protein